MNSKNHKQNTNFQIAHFLVGSCHTADGAYSLLCDLRESRQAAIDNYNVSLLRNKAKRIRAEKLISNFNDEAERLEGEADLLELENNERSGKILYGAALDEIAFIDKCIAAIQPLRRFKDLPDLEAHETAQFDEWKLELMRRAENFLITAGNIPTDEFNTMRMHPAFQSDIMPHIKGIQNLMMINGGIEILQKQLEGSPFKEINKLLE